MADLIVPDSSGIPANVEEFHARHAEWRCRACLQYGTLEIAYNTNNGGAQPVCRCGDRRPFGRLIYLSQKPTARPRRKQYRDGDSVDEVWERFGNRCVVCSATREQLAMLGFGCQRQHVWPYAEFGHEGPLVPVCVPCHEIATRRQREVVYWLKRLDEAYGESVSGSSPRVPTPGLSPDSVPTEGQDPDGQVAGVSGDHAHA